MSLIFIHIKFVAISSQRLRLNIRYQGLISGFITMVLAINSLQAGVLHKFFTSKQDKFITKYKLLKAEMTESDVLLFMDAVHPTQATKVTRG